MTIAIVRAEAAPADMMGKSDGALRHRGADEMCARLSRIVLGRAAAQVVAQGSPLASVHVLPVFAWVVPARGAAGRKGADGRLHPVRVAWAEGSVQLVDSSAPRAAAWRAEGLGRTLEGTCTLGAGSPLPEAQMPLPRETHRAPLGTRLENERLLTVLTEDGEVARWEALMALDSWTRSRAVGANRAIAAEISDGEDSSGVLDVEQLETAVTQAVFGADGRPGRLSTALDRCTDPKVAPDVDPIRFLSAEIHRTLSEVIREQIGDPPIGPKIRRLARRMGIGTPLDDLITEYRRLYPPDRLGRKRAINALTSAPRLEAGHRASWSEQEVAS